MRQRVLIVDREQHLAAELASSLSSAGSTAIEVLTEVEFSAARDLLRVKSPRLLVTALRLAAYNGLHLVHVANAAQLPTRSVVHTDAPSASDAKDVHTAGAFYEVRSRLRGALRSYLAATLPAEDRRHPIRFDRRRLARGGRRAADFRSRV